MQDQVRHDDICLFSCRVDITKLLKEGEHEKDWIGFWFSGFIVVGCGFFGPWV
ncbi:hypothetical protein PITCH_A1330004 [uncultured Desulfobacterium sp.]|uniref:Uncharacterized protein n=1 Tax=uncultured Desulfobacterium sp. TaxID=201089 RepID=A0A445MSN7_9BACT|nr:hypothetical protein PITCH_A1330004 [uncultured Desulfobacterium sp.]